ncbi:MAG: sterol desaturase family protein [Ilumatobacter sp.]|uniref:sterol desaturase family protein n=1 Tax=Ilumatobacter sp. TaxID=1967498 RepID=UPI00391C185B
MNVDVDQRPLLLLPAPTPGETPERSLPDPRTARSRRARRLMQFGAAALIAASFALDRSVWLALAFLFVIVVPFEKLFPRHRGQRIRRPGVGTDVAHGLAAPVLATASLAVAVVVGVASLAWLPGLLLRPVVEMLPAALLPFVGIMLFDLATYWVHRWSHEVPLLWRFHAVHHSTEHLDWVSGFRNHPFDGAILAPPFVLLMAAGFDAQFTGILAVIQIASGLFLHANVRWRLRPLHRIVITPEFHHWHHTNERAAHHSNYSVFLPLWDTLFGTYFMPSDRRPQVYGIDEPMPLTLVGQLRQPFVGTGPIRSLAWRALRHPVTTTRELARHVRAVLGDIWRSTTRPTRRTELFGE